MQADLKIDPLKVNIIYDSIILDVVIKEWLTLWHICHTMITKEII